MPSGASGRPGCARPLLLHDRMDASEGAGVPRRTTPRQPFHRSTHEVPHATEHRHHRQRGRLRPLDHRHRLVGRDDRRRGGGAAARGARARASPSSTPPTPTATAAARSSSRPPSAPGATEVVYATKFGYDWYSYSGERKGQNEIPQDFSPAFVRKALEGSLQRLEDRLHRRLADPQRAHGAGPGRRADRAARRSSRPRARSRPGAWRSGRRSAGSGKASSPRASNAPAVQMIWNMLEPFPGDEMVRAAAEAGTDTAYFIRVPHSSGMLEGKYTSETTFAPTDHRSHRPKSWLINGIKKVETLRFLERPEPHARPGRDPVAAGRAARDVGAAQHLRPRAVARVRRRVRRAAAHRRRAGPRRRRWRADNFGLPPEEGRYKGTMSPPSDLVGRTRERARDRPHRRRAGADRALQPSHRGGTVRVPLGPGRDGRRRKLGRRRGRTASASADAEHRRAC